MQPLTRTVVSSLLVVLLSGSLAKADIYERYIVHRLGTRAYQVVFTADSNTPPTGSEAWDILMATKAMPQAHVNPYRGDAQKLLVLPPTRILALVSPHFLGLPRIVPDVGHIHRYQLRSETANETRAAVADEATLIRLIRDFDDVQVHPLTFGEMVLVIVLALVALLLALLWLCIAKRVGSQTGGVHDEFETALAALATPPCPCPCPCAWLSDAQWGAAQPLHDVYAALAAETATHACGADQDGQPEDPAALWCCTAVRAVAACLTVLVGTPPLALLFVALVSVVASLLWLLHSLQTCWWRCSSPRLGLNCKLLALLLEPAALLVYYAVWVLRGLGHALLGVSWLLWTHAQSWRHPVCSLHPLAYGRLVAAFVASLTADHAAHVGTLRASMVSPVAAEPQPPPPVYDVPLLALVAYLVTGTVAAVVSALLVATVGLGRFLYVYAHVAGRGLRRASAWPCGEVCANLLTLPFLLLCLWPLLCVWASLDALCCCMVAGVDAFEPGCSVRGLRWAIWAGATTLRRADRLLIDAVCWTFGADATKGPAPLSHVACSLSASSRYVPLTSALVQPFPRD